MYHATKSFHATKFFQGKMVGGQRVQASSAPQCGAKLGFGSTMWSPHGGSPIIITGAIAISVKGDR